MLGVTQNRLSHFGEKVKKEASACRRTFVQMIEIFVQIAYTKNTSRKKVDDMTGITTNISIRMDDEPKARANALFAGLGMALSTAFNIFARRSLREGGIPFDISLNQPAKETIATMLETERIVKGPGAKHCSDAEEMFTDLKT